MLRITVELVPLGIEHLARTLGTMTIGLVRLSKGKARGDYVVRRYGKEGRFVRQGLVVNHRRKAETAWSLVRKAVLATTGKEGGKRMTASEVQREIERIYREGEQR